MDLASDAKLYRNAIIHFHDWHVTSNVVYYKPDRYQLAEVLRKNFWSFSL